MSGFGSSGPRGIRSQRSLTPADHQFSKRFWRQDVCVREPGITAADSSARADVRKDELREDAGLECQVAYATILLPRGNFATTKPLASAHRVRCERYRIVTLNPSPSRTRSPAPGSNRMAQTGIPSVKKPASQPRASPVDQHGAGSREPDADEQRQHQFAA